MANASVQQQAQYDQFVKNGMRLIYADKGIAKMVKALDGNGDPKAGLANTVTAITLRLAESAKKAGKPLPPEVVLYGAGELLEQLADFSEQSGGYAYKEPELREIAQSMVDGLKQKQGGQPAQQAAAPAAPPQAAAAPPVAPAAGPELMPARGGYGS